MVASQPESGKKCAYCGILKSKDRLLLCSRCSSISITSNATNAATKVMDNPVIDLNGSLFDSRSSLGKGLPSLPAPSSNADREIVNAKINGTVRPSLSAKSGDGIRRHNKPEVGPLQIPVTASSPVRSRS
ncbi:hypothetical protein SeMB42_g02491 [Synchytrium endobioticum]|uniref:Uncharacterized protein n=1 Tax=Synchytrium endobioticum TaxID=286115 RepID=A0A507DFV5_9FUNG|nr:hypothetical protein SeMB42_g02491 [Synchytrium endobioticum]